MDTIQGHVAVGEPLSVLRANAALDNGLCVCSQCYAKLEFNFVFTAEKVETKTQCFLCGHEFRTVYRVKRNKS